MIIRHAQKEELLEVSTIFTAFEQATEHVTVVPEIAAASYTNFIERGIGGMLLAESGGKIVGGLGYVIADDLHSGAKYAVETFWFMLPEHRGGGMLLVEEFERVALEYGCAQCAMIHLTDSFPDVLERVYRRRGYQLVEKHYMKELTT